MVRELLLVVCSTLCGCSEERDLGRNCVPAFASAELAVVGGGEDPAQHIWLELTLDGRTTVNGTTPDSSEALLVAIKAAALQHPNARAFIAADDGVSYGALMVVIDMLKQAGISRMAFAGRPDAVR